MSVFVVGINHKTAPLSLREQIYFPLEKLSFYLQDVLSQGLVKEAVLMSTCNRSELYCSTEHINGAKDWFSAQAGLSQEKLSPLIYVYENQAAIAHMMQVACGLDSLVLGEPQILGQMKTAFSESCAANGVGALFHRLFQAIFAAAKEVRTTTSIGACPVSVASAAVNFTRQQRPDYAAAQVALLGAGDMIELVLRYLQAQAFCPAVFISRRKEKAELWAQSAGGKIYGLEELSTALTETDILFSATGSAVPLITQAMLAPIMAKRSQRPLTIIDIAVPRDVEPDAGQVEGVSLYCIDDLKLLIEKNRQGREHAAEKAREMIEQKSLACIAQLQTLDQIADAISAYRSQIETLCRIELEKAKQQLIQGKDPEAVLEAFAAAFTNKLLHGPSVRLRQAGAEGRMELLDLAKQLFATSELESQLS